MSHLKEGEKGRLINILIIIKHPYAQVYIYTHMCLLNCDDDNNNGSATAAKVVLVGVGFALQINM